MALGLGACSDFRRADLAPDDVPTARPDVSTAPADVPTAPADVPTAPADVPTAPADVPAATDLGPACAPSQRLCGRTCVDPRTDPAHCGACDRRCPTDGGCVDGVCVSTPPPCGALQQPCCAGSTCAAGLVCGAGTCTAPCGGAGQRCCGTSCDAGFQCSSGLCARATCGLGEGAGCTAGALAPNCCTDGRTCATRDSVSTVGGTVCCHAQRGAPCTRNEGCCGNLLCTGGFCTAPATTCSAFGQPCTQDAACCGNTLGVRRCLNNGGYGPGPTCAQVCLLSAECASGCCANLAGESLRVCAHPRYCASTFGCSQPLGGSCDRDSQCCAAQSPANITVCERGADRCTRLCTVDAHCGHPSLRCRPDSRGVYRCVVST